MEQYLSNTFRRFILILISALFVVPVHADEEGDYYLRLKRSWTYMQRVYERINQHYVEEVDPYPLVKAGIDGMLEQLDPYTVFIEEEGERRLRMITTGKYGGLGMEVGLRNKKVTVISPIDDSPAKRNGILAGDIIEEINGQAVQGWSIDKVSRNLRGKIGTDISLLISRPGMEETFEIHMTREEIVIDDVGYAGFLDDGLAYISLDGFTDKAAAELRETIGHLQEQAEIKSMILDLRGNPGGLLEAAVDVVSTFVDKGELVVYTKGFREGEYKFHTKREPILPDVPLVVLVDGGSASASEIVAGALQDLDRAVIVGEATFGKGLVQKVFSVDKNRDAKVKVTTAKYYVPSGRCIQKRDYAQDNDIVLRDSIAASDSSTHLFYTRNKRKVYDKGGIYPDMPVTADSLSHILIEMIRKSLIFDFAVAYHSQHPVWQGAFTVNDSLFKAFRSFIDQRDFNYDVECSKELNRIEKMACNNGYSSEIKQLIEQLREKLVDRKELDIEKHADQIREYLRLELAEIYLGKKERDRMALQTDQQAKSAVTILLNEKSYDSILAIH